MGVLGLWTLLEPVGKPVALETLENKVLAVDVSIWLHQATKGFRDSTGNPLPNAHLLGVFHRVCKLLFYKIKPVFVFDGGVPQLKKQTIYARHSRRDKATRTAGKLNEKLLLNYIRSEAIGSALNGNKNGRRSPKKKPIEKDMFELPPLSTLTTETEDSEDNSQTTRSVSQTEDLSAESSEDETLPGLVSSSKFNDIHSLDVTSKEFLGLPAHVQHEILTNLKEKRKQNSWAKLHEMPQESNSFSSFQVERLLRRRCLQQRLDEVSRELGQQQNTFAGGFDPGMKGQIESRRLVSDNSTHYILFKKNKEEAAAALSGTKEPITDEKQGTTSQLESLTILDDKPDLIDIPTDSDDDSLTQEQILTVIQQTQDNPIDTVPTELSDSSDSDESFVEVEDSVQTPAIEDDDIFADVFRNQAKTRDLQQPAAAKQDQLRPIMERNDLNHFPDSGILPSSIPNEPVTPKADGFKILEIPEETIQAAAAKADQNVLITTKDETTILQKSISAEEIQPQAADFQVRNIAEDTSEEVEPVQPSAEPDSGKVTPDEKSKEPIVDDFARKLQNLPESKLAELHSSLLAEQQILAQQRAQQERMGASLDDEMYIEVQELLRLFGIPFIIAPMEAEAQCAFLDLENITEGSITDDSDIWLFGGRRVYKNFFNQGKYVQFFEAEDIARVFRLNREKLINIALLTGSDYTEGIESVGPVTAVEILAEFPGDGMEALERFGSWLRIVQSKKNAPPENKIRQKLRNLHLKPGFPNKAVVEAYLRPEINDSREKFTWASPDFDGLRDFARQKLGWNAKSTDSILLPVLQRYSEKTTQMRIDSYFRSKTISSVQDIQISKRLLEALNKADFHGNDKEDLSDVKMDNHPSTSSQTKKRKSRGKEASVAGSSTGQSLAEVSLKSHADMKKRKMEENKLKAIEIFRKSQNKKKTAVKKPARSSAANLSESDSD